MVNRKSMAVLAASTWILAGCGAGNVVGSVLGINEAFEESRPSSTNLDVSTTEVSNDAGAGNSSNDALTQLFGTAYFLHGFSNQQRVFLYTTNFSGSSLQQTSSGGYVLNSRGRLSSSDDGGETVSTAEQDTPFSCVYIDSVDLYLCTAAYSADFTDFFLLNRLANGVSTGNYEFCSNTGTVDECVDGLVNEPDGGVRLTIAPASAVATPASADAATTSVSMGQAMGNKAYSKQGTVGYNANHGIVTQRSPHHSAIVEAGEQLLSRLQ